MSFRGIHATAYLRGCLATVLRAYPYEDPAADFLKVETFCGYSSFIKSSHKGSLPNTCNKIQGAFWQISDFNHFKFLVYPQQVFQLVSAGSRIATAQISEEPGAGSCGREYPQQVSTVAARLPVVPRKSPEIIASFRSVPPVGKEG